MGIVSNLLFGNNQKKASYEDALKDKYYNEGIQNNYDRIYGGLNDYLDKTYTGGARKYKSDIMQQNQLAQNESTNNYKASRYNTFGNGIIGSLLNPIAQTASAVGDLAGMALSGGKQNAWDSSKNALGVSRDIGSDLGALGEAALTVVPMAKSMSLAKAGKAVAAGNATAKQAAKIAASQAPKSLGQKIAQGALFGAGYGATGSMRDMGFENFDPSKLATSVALGAGVSGGLAGVGHGLGKAWDKYTSAPGDTTIYQDALNHLKNDTQTATISPSMRLGGGKTMDAVKSAPRKATGKWANIDLDNLDAETLENLVKDGFKHNMANYDPNTKTGTLLNGYNLNRSREATNLLRDYLENGAPRQKAANFGEALNNLGANLQNIRNDFAKTKAGANITSLLKTKKGKVIAGAGGGLLLAQLMKGKNTNTLTDEEIQELYNTYKGEK